jgi:hypothetical protein
MDLTQTENPRHALWVCPNCGVRLVSRNLWHSCGRFALEALFDGAAPGVLDLARRYVELLRSLGDVQVIPQKTRLCRCGPGPVRRAASRKKGFLASFALRRWVDSPRIVKTADYGPGWRGHFVWIRGRTGSGRRAERMAPGVS